MSRWWRRVARHGGRGGSAGLVADTLGSASRFAGSASARSASPWLRAPATVARRAQRSLRAVLALAGVFIAALGATEAKTPAGRGEGRVLVTRIEGPISPVTAEALERALRRAAAERYEALVVEIDTPGGLETSMRDMIKAELASPVPVIAWVTPSGARAASAGVFVVMAADVAAMSPGTNIGAATPVNMGGPMDSTMARKSANDAAAFARTVARQRGRSVAWAEQAVRQAVAASDSEAVELDVVDFVAATLPELLERADGRSWTRGGATRTLRVRGLPVDRIEPGFRQRLLAVIADPNVAYILLMLGFYGLLFELQNPGAVLPGIVGAICLILAFLALSVLPVNYAGIALILLAVVFFLAEIKVTSHGLLAAGGVLSLLLGSLILFQSGGSAMRIAWPVIAGVTVATAVFFLAVVSAGLKAQRGRVVTGRQGLVGTRAVTLSRLEPSGQVRIGDEIWSARSEVPVDVGVEVEITGLDGLRLRVRPIA